MSMNAHHLTYGIVTRHRDKAERVLDELISKLTAEGETVYSRRVSRGDLNVQFESSKYIKWINPDTNARGYRLHGAYVDEELRGTDSYFDAVLVKIDGYNEYGIHWFS